MTQHSKGHAKLSVLQKPFDALGRAGFICSKSTLSLSRNLLIPFFLRRKKLPGAVCWR
jgi:hypothetical protein